MEQQNCIYVLRNDYNFDANRSKDDTRIFETIEQATDAFKDEEESWIAAGWVHIGRFDVENEGNIIKRHTYVSQNDSDTFDFKKGDSGSTTLYRMDLVPTRKPAKPAQNLYEVQFEAVARHFVTVPANSPDEAIEKAMKMAVDGQTKWEAGDVEPLYSKSGVDVSVSGAKPFGWPQAISGAIGQYLLTNRCVDASMLDATTAVFTFDEHTDNDGDTYHVEAEYHFDEGAVAVVDVYEDQVISVEEGERRNLFTIFVKNWIEKGFAIGLTA